MKKGKYLLMILLCIVSLTCVISVKAMDAPGDEPVPLPTKLFRICDKRGKNCQEIDDEHFGEDKKYNLFELKSYVIYLNNSEITFEVFNESPKGTNGRYDINISGTNKITYLNNYRVILAATISESDRRGKTVDETPSEYIPISVVGDGTLEIEVAYQIKKNAAGERYYRCWQLNKKLCDDFIDDGGATKASTRNNTSTSIDTNEVKLLVQTNTKNKLVFNPVCLTEITVNSDNTVSFNTPKYGYTLSDIKQKFGNSADAFYRAEVGRTMTMQEYNEFPPRLLKSYAGANDNVLTSDGRMKFIDTLVENGIARNNGVALNCGTSYMQPEEVVFEEATIPASWGLEYIQTDLRRSYSDTGSYLINVPEAKEMITTTQKENITFISKEEFDPSYYLRVDDITEDITDVQALSVQAKTDKVLVELYDINMYDQNDNIVKMENGTYKIKVELNDLLKKYEGYQVIYISDDNKVELIDATVEGNYIVFNTTHLSKYGIVGSEIRKTGNIITNPKTADAVVTYGLIFGALVVAVVMVLFRIRKLKKEN